MLVPPDNFGLVEPGVYRCSKLESDHFPFLETLKLRSLIVLDAEKPPRLLRTFLETNNVQLYNLGGLKITNHHHTGANSNIGKDDEDGDDMESIHSRNTRRISSTNLHGDDIELITLDTSATGNDKKKNDQWMLIEKNLILRAFELLLNKNKHNLLLVDSTSTLVGILRKIQKWNFNSIVNEYRIYTGAANKSNYYAENFLELVQTELISFEVEQINKKSQSQKEIEQSKDKEKEKEKEKDKDQLISLQSSPLLSVSPRDSVVNPKVSSEKPKESEFESSTPGVYHSQPISYAPTFTELDDDDLDEDELTDDDLLSASPQIPANLLKLVEKRKHEKSYRSNSNDDYNNDKLGNHSNGSSPGGFGGRRRITPSSSPKNHAILKRNSITNEMFFSSGIGGRRRSSIDSKLRPLSNNISINSSSNYNNSISNSKFRSPSVSGHGNTSDTSTSATTISSSFPGIRRLSKPKSDTTPSFSQSNFESLSPAEIQSIKNKYDFKFYRNLHKFSIKYENVNVIKIKLPPDEKLPSWFIRNRDSWELNFKIMNNL